MRKLFSGATLASSRGALVSIGQVKTPLLRYTTVTSQHVLQPFCVCFAPQLSCYDQSKQLFLSTGYLTDNVLTHFLASVFAVSRSTSVAAYITPTHL